jgi:hypothetical protein
LKRNVNLESDLWYDTCIILNRLRQGADKKARGRIHCSLKTWLKANKELAAKFATTTYASRMGGYARIRASGSNTSANLGKQNTPIGGLVWGHPNPPEEKTMARIINPPTTPQMVVVYGRLSDVAPVSQKQTFRTIETIGPEGTIGIERDSDRHDHLPHKGRKMVGTANSRSVMCALQSGGFSPKELIKMAMGGK